MQKPTLSPAAAATIAIHTQAPNGALVLIRATNPSDAERLLALYPKLSPQSLYLRFLRIIDTPTLAQLIPYTDVDFAMHLGLVLLLEEEIIGTARIIRCDKKHSSGELSCLLIDAYQRQGFGRLLLQHLLEQARAWGISEVFALVHPQNRAMLHLLSSLGYPTQICYEEGDYTVRLDCQLPADIIRNPPKHAVR
ncbi:MAG: GNAT family N-acetyltransferase [Ferrimonas sp.]